MTARQEKLKRQRQAKRARKMRNIARTIARLILIALVELATAYLILLIRQPVIGEVDGLGMILMWTTGTVTALYLFNPDKNKSTHRNGHSK